MIIRLLLLLILIAIRFYDLGARPPHHDEAVNGWFVDGIFDKGFYHYDPQNYHGPLYFYLLTLMEKIFGRSIEVLRMPSVFFAAAVTYTPFLFRKWLTERGAWIAAFFLAVSPAMIFYSRYAIHELGFVLACILFFYYWLKTRKEAFTRENILGLGITLGVMACMKENFILFVVSLILAETVLWAIEKFLSTRFPLEEVPSENLIAFRDRKKAAIGILAIVGIAATLIALLFSALGRDGDGIANFFQAFVRWGETGTKGNGHQKPFYYWLKLLFELEWFALLGFLLIPLALRRVSSELRLISILSFGLWLVYSLVNYKTPWCVLSFYWGMIFIAAYWISRWMGTEKKKGKKSAPQYPWKTPTWVALFLGFSFSEYQGIQAAYLDVDAENHFYIYGQTFRDFMGPLNEILDRVRENPALKTSLRIQIISKFTWPLPWILGEVKQTGYYGEANAPATLDADYVIIDSDLAPKFLGRLNGRYLPQEVRSRQWAAPSIFYKKQP